MTVRLRAEVRVVGKDRVSTQCRVGRTVFILAVNELCTYLPGFHSCFYCVKVTSDKRYRTRFVQKYAYPRQGRSWTTSVFNSLCFGGRDLV